MDPKLLRVLVHHLGSAGSAKPSFLAESNEFERLDPLIWTISKPLET